MASGMEMNDLIAGCPVTVCRINSPSGFYRNSSGCGSYPVLCFPIIWIETGFNRSNPFLMI